MQKSFFSSSDSDKKSSSSFPATTTSQKREISSNGGSNNKRNSIPQELRDEQLSRHTLYFGEAGMANLRHAKICVVGVGGVGSHTAHMLARAGVGYIRLIDFDQVTLSSLNRHACATLADVGIPKVVCLERFLQQICPDENYLKMDAVVEMYTAESGERLLQLDEFGKDAKWDLVIDAIDDVPTKAALMAQCLKAGIRVLSCMGAGGKSDVTRVHVSDLRTAARDPLATKLRQSLKKLMAVSTDRNGYYKDIVKDKKDKDKKGSSNNADAEYLENMQQLTVVYSSEKTVVKLADFSQEQKDAGVKNYGAVDGMRVRVLPVLGTMPAVMGQTLAAVALTDLGGKPFQAVPAEKVGRNVRNKIFQKLMRREDMLLKQKLLEVGETDPESSYSTEIAEKGGMVGGVWVGPIGIDQDDVDYLLDIWRNRCAVTGDRLGTVLTLTRWDDQRTGTCDNLVLMSAHALKSFDAVGGGKDKIPDRVQRIIEERLASCRLD
jgi:tRNA A37 threonylcarbamoyladenosine dehydratase